MAAKSGSSMMPHTVGRAGLLCLGVFAVALICLMPSPVTADHLSRTQTLKGLSGVRVVVETLRPEVEQAGLSRATIQSDVEFRLRQAGIGVLTESVRAPGNPLLYVILVLHQGPLGLYAYSLDVELDQLVSIVRDGSVNPALGTTWRAYPVVGTVGASNLNTIREDIGELVDDFVKAYLSVNPKN